MTAGTAARSAAPTERRDGAAGVAAAAARTEDRVDTAVAARALEAAASFMVGKKEVERD